MLVWEFQYQISVDMVDDQPFLTSLTVMPAAVLIELTVCSMLVFPVAATDPPGSFPPPMVVLPCPLVPLEMVHPVVSYVVPVPKVELLKRLSVVTVSLFAVDANRIRLDNNNSFFI